MRDCLGVLPFRSPNHTSLALQASRLHLPFRSARPCSAAEPRRVESPITLLFINTSMERPQEMGPGLRNCVSSFSGISEEVFRQREARKPDFFSGLDELIPGGGSDGAERRYKA